MGLRALVKVEVFWYSNGCMQTVSDLLCGRWLCGLGIYGIMDDGGGGEEEEEEEARTGYQSSDVVDLVS